MPPPQRRRWPRVLLFVLAGLILLALLHPLLLRGVAEMVTVEDEIVEGDFIYLLGGDVHSRPFLAAELYRRGLAPRVVVARAEQQRATRLGLYPDHTEVMLEVLRSEGVPDSALLVLDTVEGGAGSTRDEGEALRAHLVRQPARRVIVVTSDYHTGRARWVLRRALGDYPVDLRMAGAPSPGFDESDWWRSERGLLAYIEEYLKWAHNALRAN